MTQKLWHSRLWLGGLLCSVSNKMPVFNRSVLHSVFSRRHCNMKFHFPPFLVGPVRAAGGVTMQNMMEVSLGAHRPCRTTTESYQEQCLLPMGSQEHLYSQECAVAQAGTGSQF